MNSQFASPLPDDMIHVWIQIFERQKAFGEHAFDQLNDEQFFAILAPGLNSCAIIANHIAGDAMSRWTDVLTTDGEKAGRDRDSRDPKGCPANGLWPATRRPNSRQP